VEGDIFGRRKRDCSVSIVAGSTIGKKREKLANSYKMNNGKKIDTSSP